MPYISIIIPIYNVEAELPRCVHSVLGQDFSDCELILVDDGSTDRSGQIADSFRGGNVTVIHKPNGGLASARQAGLAAAAGKYVWFVDSDDAIEEDSLEDICEALRSSGADILRFGFRQFAAGQSPRECQRYSDRLYQGDSLEGFRRQVFRNIGSDFLTAWMHVYRRELIADIPMVSEREVGAEDDIFNVLAYQKARSVCCYDENWYRYYIREGSLSRSVKPMLRKFLRAYSYLREELTKANAWQVYRADIARAFLHTLLLGNGQKGQGWIFREYALNRDAADAHAAVREALHSEAVADMLAGAEGAECAPALADMVSIVKSGEEAALFSYIARLNFGGKPL